MHAKRLFRKRGVAKVSRNVVEASPKGLADIRVVPINVRYWHKADIVLTASNVRFRGKSGHRFTAYKRQRSLLSFQAQDIGDYVIGI